MKIRSEKYSKIIGNNRNRNLFMINVCLVFYYNVFKVSSMEPNKSFEIDMLKA